MVAIDPTRRRSGGALLGDRIRMNSLSRAERLHALARHAPPAPRDQRGARRRASRCIAPSGFDLIVVETAGIGQSDTEIVDLADLSLYVMTAEYGAASQLEKIDMLDFADMIVLNKFEKRGAEDALRDVRKQWRRNHPDRMKLPTTQVPVFPTIASRFNDPGVNRLFLALCARARRGMRAAGPLDDARRTAARRSAHRIPFARSARAVRARRVIWPRSRRAAARRAAPPTQRARRRAARARPAILSLQALGDAALPAPFAAGAPDAARRDARRAARRLQPRAR